MNKIKNIKVRSLIIGIIVLLVTLIVFNIIPSKEELIINEIRQSYEDKTDLTQEQIENIKLTTDNKKYLNPEENFMLGYINLFVEDNNELAYKYFEEVIKKESIVKDEFAIVYSYKFLAQKYIEEGNAERGIKYTENALYNINSKEHGEYRNLINDILRPVMEVRKGRDIAVDFLEYMIIENYKHPDKQAEFYAYRTLEEIYMSKGNYIQSAQASIKAIKLAEELGKEFFRGKSLVNLARVNQKLGDNEKALEILQQVKDIKSECDEWNDKLNNYRLLISFQISIGFGKYDEASEIIKEFDNHKSNLSDEDILDIEIIQNILRANLYLTEGDLDLAKSYLDKANEIIKVDKVIYWRDKDIYYYITYGKLSEKKGEYRKAIEYYQKSRTLSIERSNLEAINDSLLRLEIVYSKLGDEKKTRDYALQLSKIRDYEKQSMSKNYIDYIAKKDEIRKVEEKIKNIKVLNIFLIISVIVIFLFVYKINLYPVLKVRKLRKKVASNIYNNKYLAYYQPIINPKENKIVGFEALLRLKEKDKLIMPDVIIKEIEESYMIKEVSIWILKNIIEGYKTIKATKNIENHFYISMNISLNEVESDSFIDEVIYIVKKSGLEKRSICIEITENIGANNIEKVASNISRLREAGLLVAIDDFGVEYSNISIIDNIEYDIVKIDKVFIKNIDESDVSKNLIKFCDFMFKELGKSIVIEGVEENTQVEFIKNTKSNKFYIQGYFYSKPVGIDEIIKFTI